MALWVLGGLTLAAVAGGVALQVAIARNGPAVLDTVDRVAGGARGAERQALISIGDHPDQKLLVWTPEQSEASGAARPVLLFVHGGSWRDGDPEDYGFIGRTFVDAGFVVVLAGYRLGEAGIYPAMLEDTASAIAWTHDNIAEYGGDADHIVIAGHSAGAYNVVMAALEEKWLAPHDLSPSDLAGVVPLSSPVDFVPFDSDSTIASFGHVDEPAITQPLNHVSGDAPPFLLVHGEADETVKVRNTRLLTEALAAASVPVDALYFAEMDHAAPLMALAAPFRSRESHRAIPEAMIAFARDPESHARETSVPVQAESR